MLRRSPTAVRTASGLLANVIPSVSDAVDPPRSIITLRLPCQVEQEVIHDLLHASPDTLTACCYGAWSMPAHFMLYTVMTPEVRHPLKLGCLRCCRQ